jgi:hypothetical protein
MAIQTRIATHYGWKYLIMAVVCLVLGVWGIWDYVEVIPSRMQAHERGDVARAVRDAIVPGAQSELRSTARELLAEERERFAERYPEAASAAAALPRDVDEAKALAAGAADVAASLRDANQANWATALDLFQAALADPPVNEGRVLSGMQLHAYEVADLVAQQVATIKRPSVYDRPTQWAFILCLPFAPWSLWVYFATKKKIYRLDDEGTVHLSEAAARGGPTVWKPDDIQEIDMSQWMRKSIAWLVHVDGTRIKLDDYKHKNLHLIVGAIASRLYPDEWDVEAKPVKVRGRHDVALDSQPEPESGAEAKNLADEPAEKT